MTIDPRGASANPSEPDTQPPTGISFCVYCYSQVPTMRYLENDLTCDEHRETMFDERKPAKRFA